MKFDKVFLNGTFNRYRRLVFVSCLGLFASLALGLGALGMVIFPSEILAKETEENSASRTSGVVENLFLNVASIWIERNLESTSAHTVAAGLTCLDALGGPSPEKILEYVKNKISDAKLEAKLEEIGLGFQNHKLQGIQNLSCASLILNS